MTLPHAEHQLTTPIAELLNKIFQDAPGDTELVASEFNLDEIAEDDGEYLFEVSRKYDQYYEDVATEISAIVGEPVFRGGFPEAFEWSDVLEIEADFDWIAVWKKGDNHLFLQYVWGDKDMPIVITLGAA